MPPNPLLETAKLLARRERELMSLQREREAEGAWLAQLRAVLVTLAEADTLAEARATLASALVEEAPVELAWLGGQGGDLRVGVSLGGEEEHQLESLLASTGPGPAVLYHDDGAAVPWVLIGRITSLPPVDLLVARTHRTHAYYGGPYDQQIRAFDLLLQTTGHVLDAVRLREALTAERNSLQQQVTLRTADLELALSEAQQANRAKSAFLANMSHELRTPLNAIIGYSEILLEAIEASEPPLPEDVRRIERSGRHLLALISDILDLSKIEAGRMSFECRPFSVAELLQQVISSARPLCLAEKNHLELASSCSGAMIGDETRLKQILLNLLSNAARFTTHGTVRLRARDLDEDRVCFVVEDTGIGMTAEQLVRIFESFQQADTSTTRRYGGSGLGLTITRNLVELMEGHIGIQSAIDVGTEVTVVIPRKLHACAEDGRTS